MWGIFLESVVIFKNYMGFHEGGFLAVIYLLVLLYLWIAEKERTRRVIFVYVPTLLLVLFFCPVFRKLFVAALDDSETYYRLLWLLQMSLVSAYGLVKLWRKHAKIGLVLTCVAVICAGNYVYDSEHITKAENAYHIPQVAVEVAELISPEEGYTMALVPADLVYYIRQYDSNIAMPYGREMLIARWDYYNAMYEAMEEAQDFFADVKNTITYGIMGYFMHITGAPAEDTLKLCLEAYDYNADDRDIADNLALAYIRAGKNAEAAELADKIIEKNPEFVEGYYHGAQANIALGNRKKAKEQLSHISACNRTSMTTVSEEEVGKLAEELKNA